MSVDAVVRCWPKGHVISSVVRRFAAAPLVGDVIEFGADVDLTVVNRRFDPDGELHLRCDTSSPAEDVQAAFDAAVIAGTARTRR